MPETHQQSERSFRAVCKQVFKECGLQKHVNQRGGEEGNKKANEERGEKKKWTKKSEGRIREKEPPSHQFW